MQAGDTFLLPGIEDHLWMIISDPAADPSRVVVVHFLSWQSHYDQACIVQADEHPFVKHATCVNYRAARLVTAARLDLLRQDGTLKAKQPLSNELLAKIRACAEDGDIPTESYAVLRDQGFVP